jgi:hypothetical protein
VAREPHSREGVDLEDAQPILVGDGGEGLRLEDADVVDEDVYLARRRFRRAWTTARTSITRGLIR